MMDRHASFVWMRDLLDHLSVCHRQWRDAEGKTAGYLADAMKHDVDELRRLLELSTPMSMTRSAA